MQSQNFTDKSIASLILLPEILEIFKKTKIPKSDLCNLRTVSKSYYENFNSIYLKRYKKVVLFNMYQGTRTINRQARVSILNLNKKVSLIKIISNENWNELVDFGYCFHKISISLSKSEYEHIQPEEREEFIQLDPIIYSLGPHIKEINLEVFPSAIFQSRETIDSIEQLLKQFVNLEKINFEYPMDFFHLSDSKLFLINLSSKIQINLCILECDELDQDLLAQSNIFFIFNMYGSGEQISKSQNLLKKYKQFIPARIKFDVEISVSNVEEMKRLTQFYLENQKNIHDLALEIQFPPQMSLTIEEQAIIEDCLLKLCESITYLLLKQFSKVKLDMLSEIPIWPKLTYIWIDGYEHGLEILKKCPKLDHAYLDVNWDSCIFHNHQDTEENDLQEYFGHLKKLEWLGLRGLGEKSKSIIAALRKIVPADTEFWGYASN